MENYRRAPKLYHVGSKATINNEPVSIIPKHIYDAIFNSIDGKCGNQIKLILTLLGTIGDGSFGVSEAWILKSCGFSHTSYIRARKELVKMGWITLTKGNLSVIINSILTYHDDTTKIKPLQKTHDEDLECHDVSYQTHDDTNETTRDASCNKEEYINNKEYNKCHDDTALKIEISRTEDLSYILDIYSMTEDDVINIIKDNKIDDPDDFVNLLAMETQGINIVCSDKKAKKDIPEVVCDYFKFHRLNVFRANDTFRKSDLIYSPSKEDSEKIINWYYKRGGMFQSEIEIKQDCEIEAFNKIVSHGNQISAYYFRRNSFHK